MRWDPDRFWSQVAVAGHDDCWLWLGAKTSAGYGHLRLPGQRHLGTFLAHRVAYEIATNALPSQHLVIDHLCEVPLCCNPRHLELVPMSVNNQRRSGKVTTCKVGHLLDGLRRSGGRWSRYCKTCTRERDRARRAAVRIGA